MNIIIESNRLTLRPITVNDADAFFSWCSDPRVNQFVIYPLYNNKEDVIKWIKSIDPNDNEFAVVLKENNKVIGSCSIGYDNLLKGYNVGVNLHYDYWGFGYGTECIKAMIEWGKSQGYVDFVYRHFDFNIASKKVANKLGFVFEKTLPFQKINETKPFTSVIYRLPNK